MKLLEQTKARLRQPKMRRRLLVMADQGASSLSNVIVAILVARSFDSPEPFGAFSAAMIAYQLVYGGMRTIVGEPFLSLYSHADSAKRRSVIPDLQGVTTCIGVLSSTALVVVSAVLGGLTGSALLALSCVLPFVLIQDTWRFAYIVDRPVVALTVDLVWLTGVLVAFPLAPAGAGVAWYVLAWGISGALGAVVGTGIARRDLGRPKVWRWIADHRETSSRFFGEFLTVRAVKDLVITGLGVIAGLGALGAVKGSQVYYGPHNTLHTGIYLAVVPEGAQFRNEPERLRRLMAIVSLGLAALAAGWTVVGLLLPAAWGEELLGGTWTEARRLIAPMGIAVVASSVASGGFMGIRSLGDAKRSMSARLRTTPWQVVCPLGGAVIGGAVGFAIGFAIARIVSAVVWWRTLHNAIEETLAGEAVGHRQHNGHVNSGGGL